MYIEIALTCRINTCNNPDILRNNVNVRIITILMEYNNSALHNVTLIIGLITGIQLHYFSTLILTNFVTDGSVYID